MRAALLTLALLAAADLLFAQAEAAALRPGAPVRLWPRADSDQETLMERRDDTLTVRGE